MKTGIGGCVAGMGLAALMTLGAGAAQAQGDCSPENWQGCKGKPWVDGDTMETPMGSKWWPNEQWGGGDESGSTNWYTKPEVLKRALEASTGEKVYKLGHPYSADMPLFGARKFALRIPGLPAGGPFGANNLVYNDDYVSTELGQVGTQFDGLGHIGIVTGKPGDESEMRWYNGVTATEMAAGGAGSNGLQKNGVEKLHPIVARGILIDVAATRDQPMQAGDEITMEDVRKALEAQGMADFQFQPGDALIFRTGWEDNWDDAATFNSGEPGIGMEVARWAAEEVQAGVTGADTWAVEAVPNPDPGCVFCVHAFLQTRHGIVNQENMKLSELAADKTWVFTYVYSPVPMVGATGSTGAPLAIK
jgi:kynurenine formamidase